MEYYIKSVIPVIESNYNKFTMVEKTIADFFINNQKTFYIYILYTYFPHFFKLLFQLNNKVVL